MLDELDMKEDIALYDKVKARNEGTISLEEFRNKKAFYNQYLIMVSK
jgi:hypothetical protein